jgi:TM2 domain-containing membrane protein YozV
VHKNPGLAAVLSFFIVGLGQIYNGQVGKGFGLMAAAAVSGLLCWVGVGFVLLPAVWFFAVWDAYRTAERLNREAAAPPAA